MRTFKCSFGKGLSCEVHISDTPPAAGDSHVQEVLWTGNPTRKIIRPYIAWFNSVNTILANEWNLKLMHCFQVAQDKWEFWIYEPGKPPLLDDSNGGDR